MVCVRGIRWLRGGSFGTNGKSGWKEDLGLLMDVVIMVRVRVMSLIIITHFEQQSPGLRVLGEHV